jgi:hypothetical protein
MSMGHLGLGNQVGNHDGDFLADLHYYVPTRAFYGRADELGADVALAEVFLIHKLRN